MANIKVSEMTELNEVGSLDNKFMYVVTENEGGENDYNKMSLRTLSRGISGAPTPDGVDIDYTNSNMVQWGGTMKIPANSTWRGKNLTLPCDCFVWGGIWDSNISSWNSPNVMVDGIDHSDISHGVWWTGFYCSKGTVLSIKDTYGQSNDPAVYLAPLVYGNIDSDRCTVEKNMTPKALSEYIQSNIGPGKIFQAIYGKNSGVYGYRDNEQGNKEWFRFTSTSSDTHTYLKFGIRARVNALKYVLLTYPYGYSKYTKYKDGKPVSLSKKTISSANLTSIYTIYNGSTVGTDHLLKWSDFNVINMTVLDFAPDADDEDDDDN